MARGEQDIDLNRGESGMSMRRIAVLLGLIFAVTLAVVVGKRMSAEAMAVVVGVVCGVAASIPTSVLLLVVLGRRERQRPDEMEQPARQGGYPPVVVIQGGAPQALPMGLPSGYWPASQPEPSFQRSFQVVGGDEVWQDERYG